jgi:hypothetical protein
VVFHKINFVSFSTGTKWLFTYWHAKSICLNFGLGLKYNAPVNLRFDDTNPAKEEQEYVDAIKEDLVWLGFN